MDADHKMEEGERQGCPSWVVAVLQLALSGIFIVAGVYKLQDLASFEVSLIHWQLFPDEMVDSLAWGIPLVEILLGCACLTTRWGRMGLRLLLILTIVYTLLLIVEWVRGVSADCGCFGAASEHWPYYALLSRNVALIVIELLLLDLSSVQKWLGLRPSSRFIIDQGWPVSTC